MGGEMHRPAVRATERHLDRVGDVDTLLEEHVPHLLAVTLTGARLHVHQEFAWRFCGLVMKTPPNGVPIFPSCVLHLILQ